MIVSFGFRFGHPIGGVIIDARVLRNPFRQKKLRYKTGLNQEVIRDVQGTPGFGETYQKWLERATNQPRVFVGCHSGHHRSVVVAEMLAKDLGDRVYHRDINRS